MEARIENRTGAGAVDAMPEGAGDTPHPNERRPLIEEIDVSCDARHLEEKSQSAVAASPRHATCNLSKSNWISRKKNPLFHVHQLLIVIQPWGIALALIAFTIDYYWRIEARTRGAWEVIALGTPNNGGIVDAMEFLNSQGVFKRRQQFAGIDLSANDSEKGIYLRNIKLSGADLRRANLYKADLKHAKLTGVSSHEAILSKADLSWADLSGARLVEANLIGANLLGASLARANLQGAELVEAKLLNVHLDRADLRDANLKGAKNLTQEQLDNSCGDDQTQLSEGLTIPMCSETGWYSRYHKEKT